MTGRATGGELFRPLTDQIIEAQVLGAGFHNPLLLGGMIRALRASRRDDFSMDEYWGLAALINGEPIPITRLNKATGSEESTQPG